MRHALLLTLSVLALTQAHASEKIIRQLAPQLNPAAVTEAVAAMQCAQQNGVGMAARKIAIIDYTLSSRMPRLWVLDLNKQTLLYKEHVAHGRGSGEDIATVFSDLQGSHQSSLGLYLTADTYEGNNGYTLRLQGLSRGFNGSAMERLIVMHGAPYVDPALALKTGRLGRSLGCPAVRSDIAQGVIDALKEGQFIYAYGPGTAPIAQRCHAESFAHIGTTD